MAEHDSRDVEQREAAGSLGDLAKYARAVGSPEDEADPDKGYWMCRLIDGGALGAAGFSRVRKAELAP